MLRTILLAQLLSGPALAASQTWDIASFDAPAWPVARTSDSIGYTEIDQAKGTFCQLAVFNSQPSLGDPAKDFAAEWRDLIADKQANPSTRPAAGRTPSGLDYVEAGGLATVDGKPYFFHLLVFSPGGRRFTVQISSGDQQGALGCKARLQPMLASLRVASSAAAVAAPVAQPATVAGFRGGGISGVWMGFKQDPMVSYAPQPSWVVFFDDGQFFQNLPNEGLLGFDRGASRARLSSSWGTFTWKGGAGLMKKPGVDAKYDTKLATGKNGQITLDGVGYFRCADVDGLTLDGAWTSYANPNDPALDRPGARPVFRFTRDGRFVDEGVFATFIRDPGADAPGSGTYTVKDFTLTLRYSDGRVKPLAFNGSLSLDPAKDTSVLYIHRALFNERR